MVRDWRAQFKRVVGDRMRRLRLASRLSRAAVAQALNLSEKQYTSYERGLSHASSAILMQLASFLDIAPRELSRGLAALVTAAGFTDIEQELYKDEPATASRSRVKQATARIKDQGTLNALAYFTELLAELDDQGT